MNLPTREPHMPRCCSVLLRTEDRVEGGLGPRQAEPSSRRPTVRLGDRSYRKPMAGSVQRTWLCLGWWHRSISPVAKRRASDAGRPCR